MIEPNDAGTAGRPVTAATRRWTGPLSTVGPALLIGIVAFLGWASPRGLDITDDGFYLLVAAHPGDLVIWPTGAHWVTAALFRLTGTSVAAFRFAGVVLTVLTAWLLFLGFERVRQAIGVERPARAMTRLSHASFVALGGLLFYVMYAPTPSYNTVNTWAINLVSAATFAGLARLSISGSRDRWAAIWFALAGATTAVATFGKFSTGLPLLGLVGLLTIAWPRDRLAGRGRLLGIYLASAGVLAAGYFAVVQSPAAFWRMISGGVEIARTLSARHGQNVLLRYSREIGEDLAGTVTDISVPVLAAIGLLSLGFLLTPARKGLLRAALGAALAGALVVAAGRSTLPVLAFDPAYTCYQTTRLCFEWLLLLAAASLIWQTRTDRTGVRESHPFWRRESVLLAGFLFLLPLVGAVGTGNYLRVNMGLTLAPWFCLMLVPLGRLGESAVADVSRSGAILAASASCALLVLMGAAAAPYRLNSVLTGQNTPTSVGAPASRVLMDPPTSQFFQDLRRDADSCGFRPGDDLLAFFNMPGIVFALGGRAPGIPWFTDHYPGSFDVARLGLEAAGSDRIGRSFLLLTAAGEDFARGLGWAGVRFPDGYRLCHEATLPYAWPGGTVRLWRPVASRP